VLSLRPSSSMLHHSALMIFFVVNPSSLVGSSAMHVELCRAQRPSQRLNKYLSKQSAAMHK
jgi:hypothetical protein